MQTTITTKREPTAITSHAAEPILIPTGGAASAYPANSLGAFRSAFGISDAIALDIRLVPRRENATVLEPVIFEPRALFHRGVSEEVTGTHSASPLFEALRALRRGGEPLVPSLTEVLDTYSARSAQTGKRTELNIRLVDDRALKTVIAHLQERIRSGELSWGDCILQCLYTEAQDITRLEAARALEGSLRLGLIAARGALSTSELTSHTPLLSAARRLGIESMTIDRRDLTPEVSTALRHAGFAVGCHHVNTSDEIEGALASGATRIFTEGLHGASRDAVAAIRLAGSPLFHDLQRLGFYSLRDSLHDIHLSLHEYAKNPTTSTQRLLPLGVDAALCSRGRSPTLLQSASAGFGQPPAVNLADVEVPRALLGLEGLGTQPRTWGSLLSLDGLTSTFRRYASEVAARSLETPSDEFSELVDALDIISIAELGDSEAVTPLRNATPYCGEGELRILEETAREVMTRAGRCLGMLATTGLHIGSEGKDFYVVEIDSDILEISTVARSAAREQVATVFVRAGVQGQVQFVSV